MARPRILSKQEKYTSEYFYVASSRKGVNKRVWQTGRVEKPLRGNPSPGQDESGLSERSQPGDRREPPAGKKNLAAFNF